jgi:hypothetical protein
MTDRGAAGQAVEEFVRKDLRHEPHATVLGEAVLLGDDDSRAFLPAVLLRVQTVVDDPPDRRGDRVIRVGSKHPEEAALLVQSIFGIVDIEPQGRHDTHHSVTPAMLPVATASGEADSRRRRISRYPSRRGARSRRKRSLSRRSPSPDPRGGTCRD